MARKKPKVEQLSLFDPLYKPQATSTIEAYWVKFLPIVKKLHDDRLTGKNIHGGYGCKDWWKSRYSDFLTNTNTAPKDHAEWEWRHLGYQLWEGIWREHQQFLTNVPYIITYETHQTRTHIRMENA